MAVTLAGHRATLEGRKNQLPYNLKFPSICSTYIVVVRLVAVLGNDLIQRGSNDNISIE